MLLSRLNPITLYNLTSTRGLDGDLVEEYESIFQADCAVQYLTPDEVNYRAYGANLDKTYRIKSNHNDLEPFLLEKTNNSPDNLTKYLVEWNERKYSIVKVTPAYIDIQWR